MRKHYFSIYNKTIFNEGEVYCEFSCFTYISKWKDFKEISQPKWFQSLIKTGNQNAILIQINTLCEFSERIFWMFDPAHVP